MNKFKRWLIHKLGGYTDDDLNLVKICYKETFDESRRAYNKAERAFIISSIKWNMFKYIKPNLRILLDPKTDDYKVDGYIKIPKEFVSEEYFNKEIKK